ncbi:MAG: hypothetical protein LC745_10790 [Planctomycetia bacterium]|nr:hypothetical protein [Planctomycetia bacterium]
MREEFVDSRGSSRYEAVKSAVYLGWWEEPEFRTCAAALRNLSHGGAMVHVALLPPEGSGLWLCLAGTPPGEWVQVSVVTAAGRAPGPYQVRLMFVESCPYEMFNGAVLGITPA